MTRAKNDEQKYRDAVRERWSTDAAAGHGRAVLCGKADNPAQRLVAKRARRFESGAGLQRVPHLFRRFLRWIAW